MADWDKRFMEMAWVIGRWSKDPSTKCGAVIAAPDHSVISVGFNGFPAGMSDTDELYNNREEKLSRMVHAEMNALLYAYKRLPEECSLYTSPILPCERCVVHMLQAGIRRFVTKGSGNDSTINRWSESLAKTRQYIEELNGEIIYI